MKAGPFLFFQFHLLLVLGVSAALTWQFCHRPRKSRIEAVSSNTTQAVQLPAHSSTHPPTKPPSAIPHKPLTIPPAPLIRNGTFLQGLSGWNFWLDAVHYSNAIRVVELSRSRSSGMVVRIENPLAKMIGVYQPVSVSSGAVYRLSAVARSVATNDSTVLFGGRLAFFIPGQHEYEILWVSEYNEWWQKSVVFTNAVAGTAVVYAHLGFGKTATTGEFTDITLEALP